ncbi:MAG: patatin-like phospholipase family protein [candidate division WOR-3 bacterium]|nr:MAG: patatin-like phospholipase family protein [candidate division WOR-3 bacterium]
MSDVIKILSIDGGGIRGLIPAVVLAEIEKRTGKPVSELFDLIAGTSTGGILALGLTKPGPDGRAEYPAERLIQLYKDKGPRIFSSSIWHKIRSAGGLADERYPAKGIEEVLEEYFGDARLKDSVTEVLVTGYEIERGSPWFFRRRSARTKPGYDFDMKQVARATSAAPTYFEPIRIEAEGRAEYYAVVDGGVYANNPAMCAYVDALASFPEAGDFLVLSLGTGTRQSPILYHDAKDWGLAGWAKPILGVVFDGVSDTVEYQLGQLLPEKNGVQRYYRFQTKVSKENSALDNADQDNLRALVLIAEQLVEEHTADIDRLCAQLG